MEQPATRVHGSCALQGCLIGSVVLFVILLLVMLFLAVQRFREETGVGSDESAAEVQRDKAALVAIEFATVPRFVRTG